MKYHSFIFWATFAFVAVTVFGLCNIDVVLDYSLRHERDFLFAATIATIAAAGFDAIGQHLKFNQDSPKPHDNWMITGKLAGAVAIVLVIFTRAGSLS